MFNHPIQPNKTKYSRLLIKRSPTKQQTQPQRNIFSLDRSKILKDLNDISSNKLHQYDICGDKKFKVKFLGERENNGEKMNRTGKQDGNGSFISNNNEDENPEIRQTCMNFNSKHKMHQTIYLNQTQRKTFLSTLNPIQINKINRQNKNIENFKATQQKWNKIQSHLKFRQPKLQTVTFSSVKTMYVHQNPQKLEIINDMLPQYWRNSLRSNDKKLKSHLRGHKFKHQLAEQMLQTLKGTRKMESSIPKIDENRTKKYFVNKKQNKFQLKGKKVQNNDGFQTMRDFHKQTFNSLNQTINQRGQSLNKSRGNKFKSFGKSNNKQIDRQNFDITEQMTMEEKKTYQFCTTLQKLDHIDNQMYIKHYDKNKKWLNEAFQMQS